MYDFVFYFFYGILARRNDNMPVFTAKIFVMIIVALHLLSIAIVLSHFDIIGKLPVFSKTYLYNKLYWYGPIAILTIIVFLFYGKNRVKAILEKYDAKENFYSFGNILLFLSLIVIPALVIAKFK